MCCQSQMMFSYKDSNVDGVNCFVISKYPGGQRIVLTDFRTHAMRIPKHVNQRHEPSVRIHFLLQFFYDCESRSVNHRETKLKQKGIVKINKIVLSHYIKKARYLY